MNDPHHVSRSLSQLRATLRRLVRIGTVTAVFADRGEVRVRFGDIGGGAESWRCPVVVPRTHQDSVYLMPSEGERVVVVSLPYAEAHGFVVGAFYQAQDAPPESDADRHVLFRAADGSLLRYDEDAGDWLVKAAAGSILMEASDQITLNAAVKVLLKAPQVTAEANSILLTASDVTVDADQVTVDAALTTFTGNVVMQQALTVAGLITAGSLTVSGTATFQGTLEAGTIEADDVQATNLSTTGTVQLNGSVSVNGVPLVSPGNNF